MPQAVLVVDDEPEIRATLARAIGRALPGTRVVTAADGQEALARLAAEPVDVIVTDYRMPGMTGVELLARSLALAPTASRILVTAYAEVPVVAKALNEGHVSKFLQKPVPMGVLVGAIRGQLERQAAQASAARAVAASFARSASAGPTTPSPGAPPGP
jgi:DNA-binding NtrC family response regulator